MSNDLPGRDYQNLKVFIYNVCQYNEITFQLFVDSRFFVSTSIWRLRLNKPCDVILYKARRSGEVGNLAQARIQQRNPFLVHRIVAEVLDGFFPSELGSP